MRISPIALFFWTHSIGHLGLAVTYNDTNTLLKDLLSSARYNRDIRPNWNQLQPTTINSALAILSVIEINEVSQRFTVSAYATMWWADELLQWHVSMYGGLYLTRINPDAVWKPKFFLSNTADHLEPFKDQKGEMIAYFYGYVVWQTGNVLETTCTLDVEKFPFDKQTCSIGLCAFGYTDREINISAVVDPMIPTAAEWEVSDSRIRHELVPLTGTDANVPCVDFLYTLKRKASVFVLEITLPVILISLINNLVFLIPVDSGEKISFAVTVLLALTLFMTLISSMLPRSSVPKITIYLCILMVVSVLTAVLTIITVAIHHAKERSPDEEKFQNGDWWNDQQTAQNRHTNGHLDLQRLPTSAAILCREENYIRQNRRTTNSNSPRDFKKLARIIDIICFILFNCAVLVATLWFFIAVQN